MENSMFKRSEYLTSEVKAKLINSFISQEVAKSFQKSFESESIQSIILKEKSDNHSQMLTKSFDNTRPSSVNSGNRKPMQSKTKQKEVRPIKIDAAVPAAYKSAVQNLKEKLNIFNESVRNENADYLLFSFVILYTGIWGNDLENPVLSFLQANIWNTYREILSKNEILKRIPLFPQMVRLKKIPQEDLKKSLSWFCMINSHNLETLKELYEFLRETFIYARKFYFITILLPEYKPANRQVFKVEPKKIPPKALNDSTIRNQTPLNRQKLANESKFLTPNFQRSREKSLFASARHDLDSLFNSFWTKFTGASLEPKSKEELFKAFKAEVKTPLATEASLHILKLITEKLTASNLKL